MDFPHREPKPAPGEAALPRSYEDNQETDVLANGVHNFTLDNEAREIYLTKGKRVLVYDMDNGDFKRGWGGRGMPLNQISDEPTPAYEWTGAPPPDQDAFAPALHCILISADGLVYVCERGMNRIQGSRSKASTSARSMSRRYAGVLVVSAVAPARRRYRCADDV